MFFLGGWGLGCRYFKKELDKLEPDPKLNDEPEACGYPGQTFRGDCFIGRVFDDTQAVACWCSRGSGGSEYRLKGSAFTV